MLLHDRGQRDNAVMELNLPDFAWDLVLRMDPGSQYRLQDFNGYKMPHVIEAWTALTESPLAKVIVPESNPGQDEWEAARLELNELGAKVHEMLVLRHEG